jgi:phage tail sheath gpL-like
MAAVNVPKVTVAITPSPQTPVNQPQKVLFIGQQGAGTATSGELVKNIGASGEEDTLFARRSMLATMIREFRRINDVTQVDAIPLDDDGAASTAAGDIVFTGAATASGTYSVSIQSRKLHNFTLSVASGDTPTILSAALETLINADSSILVTADGTTTPGTVDITASFGGTEGNFIGIEVDGLVAGLTTSVTAMTGGGTDPDLTGLFDVIGETRYQTIVWPGSYDQTVVTDLLDPRFNPTNAVLDGVAFTARTDTSANLITSVSTANSESLVLLGNKTVSKTSYKGSALFEFDPTISSEFAAIRTLRLTSGQNIASLLVGGSITNAFGGPSRAATPYHNTPFDNLPVIETELGWTTLEQSDLNENGVSFLGNNNAGNTVIAGDIVTTYLTNAAAVEDVTFKYLNYVDTASNVREFFFNNNKAQYSQTVLTTGSVVPNTRMANVDSIEAFQASLYKELSDTDNNGVLYALTVAGSDGEAFFKDNLTVSIDSADGKVTIFAKVPIVTQLREIDETLQIAFDIN